MSETNADTLEASEQELKDWREILAKHEQAWKVMRAESRAAVLHAITVHGMSMSRAAALSGHHRATVKIWLDIFNAEQKGSGRRG